jgi:hypothetical protein
MKDLFLGHTQAKPEEPAQPVTLSAKVRRQAHMMVLGSPGSGKSKFLEHIIREDIKNRQGLCLVDLHGTLFDNVRKWCARQYYLDRPIVILDPTSEGNMKGFNPFRPQKGVTLDVQVSSMVDAIMRVWGAADTQQTPTLERVLRLMFSAMIVKSIPLHEAYRLIAFDARAFRQDVIGAIDAEPVRQAWLNLADIKQKGEWRGEVLSTENRIFRLITSPQLTRFMGVLDDGYNVDALSLMDSGAVVLVNLRETDNFDRSLAKAVGALLLNDFFKAAIRGRKKDAAGNDPSPFHFVMDEWQNYVTPDIKTVAAETRKFGLLLVLANQDLSQVREAFGQNFLNTLMTCCQIKACFGGLNEEDASIMVREMIGSQLDLDETKSLLYQTKFWPIYKRDRVYVSSGGRSLTKSASESRGSSHGHSTSGAQGVSVGIGSGRSQGFNEDGEPWPYYTESESVSSLASLTQGESDSSGTSESRTAGQSDTDSEGWSVADIPILIPEPFQEVSQRATYSLEEQRFRWTCQMKEQYVRHCLLKVPYQPTIPLLVPIVPEVKVYPHVMEEYESRLAQEAGALPVAKVDNLLEGQRPAVESRTITVAARVLKDEDFLE